MTRPLEGGQGEPFVVILPDPDAVAVAVAEQIVDAAVAAVADRGRVDFVTTGGSTPIRVYAALLREPLRDRLPWAGLHVWFGDDRYVPRDHPASNVALLDDAFFGAGSAPRVPLRPEQVHPFPTGAGIGEGRGPAWCAEQYAAEIRDAVPPGEGGWPRFDLILVGIGPDGHLLSVFPGSDAFASTDLALAIPAPTHVVPHVPRVTLNPGVLDASPVVAAVTGSEKAGVLGRIFGPEIDVRQWPAQVVRRPGARWILDAAAAALLPGS